MTTIRYVVDKPKKSHYSSMGGDEVCNLIIFIQSKLQIPAHLSMVSANN